MDVGERDYQPQVLLVTTFDQRSEPAQVEPILIKTSTSFLKQSISGFEAVKSFCQQVAATDPLGDLMIEDIPVDLRSAVEQAIYEAAPRLELRWLFEQSPLPGIQGVTSGPDFHDVSATVQAYLASKFRSDPERLAWLLKAFENLNSSADSGAQL